MKPTFDSRGNRPEETLTRFFVLPPSYRPRFTRPWRLREREGRQFVFPPVTKLLCCLLIAFMAVPSGLWACPPNTGCQSQAQCCNKPDGCCTTGGAGGGGPGPRNNPAAAPNPEDPNQNTGEDADVLTAKMSAAVTSTEINPLAQPGGLRSATLALGRYNADNTDTGPLGAGWTHNYNVRLFKHATNIVVLTTSS